MIHALVDIDCIRPDQVWATRAARDKPPARLGAIRTSC